MSKEAEKWNKFARNIKNKRQRGEKDIDKTKSGIGSSIVVEGEMVVQRLANIATGKSMKYERIGPQEFVMFPYDDLNLDNLKSACYEHFRDRLLDVKMEADILASQNGPSCSKLSHLKNFKLIYVRFIHSSRIQHTSPSRMASVSVLQTLKDAKKKDPVPVAKVPILPSKTYPKSISISKMMKLGSEISMKVPTPDEVDLIDFDITKMKWGHPHRVNLFIDEQPFSKGGFRVVFKAKTSDGNAYVIKRFLPETLLEMEKINDNVEKKETVSSLTKKAVQMHKLAKSFTDELNKYIDNIGKKEEFGLSFTYNAIFLGIIRKSDKDETVVVEEFIPGQFTKYVNNDGSIVNQSASALENQLKAECLCHYSYMKSDKRLLLVDIQGSGSTLFDPEIATAGAFVRNGELNFCMGNLSDTAINMFTSLHTCNLYCHMVGLLPFPKEE